VLEHVQEAQAQKEEKTQRLQQEIVDEQVRKQARKD